MNDKENPRVLKDAIIDVPGIKVGHSQDSECHRDGSIDNLKEAHKSESDSVIGPKSGYPFDDINNFLRIFWVPACTGITKKRWK